jgi:hypothetical protein
VGLSGHVESLFYGLECLDTRELIYVFFFLFFSFLKNNNYKTPFSECIITLKIKFYHCKDLGKSIIYICAIILKKSVNLEISYNSL